MTPLAIYNNKVFGYYAFARICPKCHRFVKADATTVIPEILKDAPNATCKKCGRVQMDFYDWITETEDELCPEK